MKMRPSWGVRDGVRSVKTAGTGEQAGLLGGGFCSYAGGGVDKVPGPGWPREVGERLPQQARSFSFQERFQFNSVIVSLGFPGGSDSANSTCSAGDPG